MKGKFQYHPLRILCLFLVIWCGIKAVRDEWDGYEGGVFSIEFLLIFLVMLSIACFLTDVHNYKLNRKRIQFIPSLIALIFLLTISFHKIKTAGINASHTIFSIRTIPGSGEYIRIDFKERGYVKLTEGSLFGSTYHYGSYSRNGDTLIITETSYRKQNMQLPLKGILKDSIVVWDGLAVMMMERVAH